MALADGHTPAPQSLRALFKQWQRLSVDEAVQSNDILNLLQHENTQTIQSIDFFSQRQRDIDNAVRDFLASDSASGLILSSRPPASRNAFSIPALPG
jgi:hypothetical protein